MIVLFQMRHKILPGRIDTFTEKTAPDWLTGVKTIKGSTADSRWFWNEHVLTLKIGQSVNTDFRTIERLQ